MSGFSKLLQTMELIHYIEKFKNRIIILVVRGKMDIRDIIPDIIVLQSFNIKVALIIGNIEDYSRQRELSFNEAAVEIIMDISSILKKNRLKPFISLGSEIIASNDGGEYGKILSIDDSIKKAIDDNKISVIVPLGMDVRGNYYKILLDDLSLELAKELNSEDIYILSEKDGVSIGGVPYKFLNYNQVWEVVDKDVFEDERVESTMKFALRAMESGIKNIGIISGNTGNIYTELLTYDISGTFISRAEDENIRRAKIDDILSIYLLIKNEVERDNILPVAEKDIEEELNNYIVYEVDSSIIGVGKLNDYGDSVEIAKLAMLPRYRGGKRAGNICRELVKKARVDGKKQVFGLTINRSMMKLFEDIGLKEVKREVLPKKWQEKYDFSRPSKAYLINLDKFNG